MKKSCHINTIFTTIEQHIITTYTIIVYVLTILGVNKCCRNPMIPFACLLLGLCNENVKESSLQNNLQIHFLCRKFSYFNSNSTIMMPLHHQRRPRCLCIVACINDHHGEEEIITCICSKEKFGIYSQ